ncbi:hypothetical protein [Ferribacterium limneticum]|uniref:hypothetical protein n=1 Tax=Ferribacterium limneticum TaxID=76259 RepID=UPI001CFB7924|nr:hypothetical protein [Ferribacterium limneticum]UCV18336.1 hypothetical protein KI610_16255 [Ferribacterium limneticum]
MANATVNRKKRSKLKLGMCVFARPRLAKEEIAGTYSMTAKCPQETFVVSVLQQQVSEGSSHTERRLAENYSAITAVGL